MFNIRKDWCVNENRKWLILPEENKEVGKGLQAEKQHEWITHDRWFVLHRTQRCREILAEYLLMVSHYIWHMGLDPSWCPLHTSVLAAFSGRFSSVTSKQFQSHTGDSCCSLSISSKSLKIMSYGFCLGKSDTFVRGRQYVNGPHPIKKCTSKVRSRLSVSKPHALNQWFSNFSTH